MTAINLNCKSCSGNGLSELLVRINDSNNMEVNVVEDSGIFVTDSIDELEVNESKELDFVIKLLEKNVGLGNVVSSGGSVIDCFLTTEAAQYLHSNKAHLESVSHTVN